jgi:hypothetical protein
MRFWDPDKETLALYAARRAREIAQEMGAAMDPATAPVAPSMGNPSMAKAWFLGFAYHPASFDAGRRLAYEHASRELSALAGVIEALAHMFSKEAPGGP